MILGWVPDDHVSPSLQHYCLMVFDLCFICKVKTNTSNQPLSFKDHIYRMVKERYSNIWPNQTIVSHQSELTILLCQPMNSLLLIKTTLSWYSSLQLLPSYIWSLVLLVVFNEIRINVLSQQSVTVRPQYRNHISWAGHDSQLMISSQQNQPELFRLW